MNTKALRQKILDLAIHGKLVPQDPNDEPASVLLERIKAEKERLIIEGKIKRTKRSKAACDKPHYPYELPEGWAWCKLEDIASDLLYGTSEKSLSEGLVPVLRMGNINRVGEIDWNNLVYTSNQADIAKYSLKQDDLLFNRTNSAEWVGKTAIYKGNKNAIYAGYIIRIRTISVNADYINYVMNSSYHRDWCDEVKTDAVNQSNINAQKLSQLYIPIPPYKEQERIVNYVQRWTTLINNIEIEKSDLALSVAETKFKILDLAIHGKLVPQDPTDEPASVLLKRINPKAEITCDNPHYRNLPKGWAVCRLEDIVEIFDNLRKPINSNERNSRIANKHKDELYPYYGATGQVGLIDAYLIDGTYLLLGEDGAPFLDKSAVKAYPIEGKCWVNNHAHILKPLCDFDYLMFYLNQVDYKDYVNGSTRLKLTQSDMRSILVLLPPIAEQKRISAKVRALFDLLDSIVYHL